MAVGIELKEDGKPHWRDTLVTRALLFAGIAAAGVAIHDFFYDPEHPLLFGVANVDGVPNVQIQDLEKDLPSGLKEVKGIHIPSLTPKVEADIIKSGGLAYQDPNGKWWHMGVTHKGNDVVVGGWEGGRGAGGKPWLDKNGVWHMHEPATPLTPQNGTPSASEDGRYASEVTKNVALGSHPVDEVADIKNPDAFRKSLVTWINNHYPKLTDAEVQKIATEIIEDGGFTNAKGDSYQLWENKDGFAFYIELPADNVPSLPKIDDHGLMKAPESVPPTPTTSAPVGPTEYPKTAPFVSTEEGGPDFRGNPAQAKQVELDEVAKQKEDLGTMKPAPAPTPEHKPEVHPVKTVSEDDYVTAKLTLSHNGFEVTNGADWPEGAKDDLVAFMHQRGIDITPEQAEEMLKNGGYSAGGHSYELWANRDSGTFVTTEKPGATYTAIAGEEGSYEADTTGEPQEVTQEDISNSSIVLRDTPTSTFAGDTNPYAAGTPEYKAWADIHALLVGENPKGWQTSTEPIDTYLAGKGYAPKYPRWPN